MLEDRWLIWKLRNGREEGLVRTYSKYKDYLLRIACGLCFEVSQAEDVVQDVFLAALKDLAAFEGQSSLRTWLVAIARHKIEDLYRQRLRTALVLDLDSTEDEPTANEIPLDEQIDKTRAGAKTRRVLARMPERYALILLWRYWEQRSARDVAAATGTTEKSVERLLARARATFKELWLKE